MIIADILAKAQKQRLRTEMEVFLAYLLGVSRVDLIRMSKDEVPAWKLAELQVGWTRILDEEPVAYLVGKKEFYGLDFYVDKRVLVPRGETEKLVDFVLEKAGEGEGAPGAVKRILEIGTGSGAVSVAIKKNRPELDMVATDLSAEALEVANKNIVRYGVDVRLICSDLLENLPDEKFDILVTNLPYIADDEEIADGVRKHEPHGALFAGEEGLDLYRRLFEQIRERMDESDLGLKWIMGEIGFMQGQGICTLAAEILPKYSCKVLKDYQNLDRYFVLELQ